jgi:hypothetical protein
MNQSTVVRCENRAGRTETGGDMSTRSTQHSISGARAMLAYSVTHYNLMQALFAIKR